MRDMLTLIDARLQALADEPESDMKTTTGIGIRRALHELEELRIEVVACLEARGAP